MLLKVGIKHKKTHNITIINMDCWRYNHASRSFWRQFQLLFPLGTWQQASALFWVSMWMSFGASEQERCRRRVLEWTNRGSVAQLCMKPWRLEYILIIRIRSNPTWRIEDCRARWQKGRWWDCKIVSHLVQDFLGLYLLKNHGTLQETHGSSRCYKYC